MRNCQPGCKAGLGQAAYSNLLGGCSPVVLLKKIFVTTALAGSATYVSLSAVGLPGIGALAAGFAVALVLRGLAIFYDLRSPELLVVSF